VVARFVCVTATGKGKGFCSESSFAARDES
jgi:hypothetical protein